MNIDKLIAWHQRKSERAVIDYNNARKMLRDHRARATHSQWAADATMHQDLVIFHRNAVKLLESINHDKTV